MVAMGFYMQLGMLWWKDKKNDVSRKRRDHCWRNFLSRQEGMLVVCKGRITRNTEVSPVVMGKKADFTGIDECKW